MITVSYTYARSHFAETMGWLCSNHVPVIVTRKGAKPIVMMPLADYRALEETVYLLLSPQNVARLATSIAATKKKKPLKKKPRQSSRSKKAS